MEMEVQKPGEDLQRLVRIIEIGIASNSNITIQSPVRLRDKDTGRLREHDVLLTIREKHHEVRVALECRDRSRKVGVPEIEAFHAKCQRTSVDQGIVVSSQGFTKTAQIKAEAWNIRCLMLEEVSQFSWLPVDTFCQVQRHITNVQLLLKMADGSTPDMSASKVFLHDGTEMTRERWINLARNALSSLAPEALVSRVSETNLTKTFYITIDPTEQPYLTELSGEQHLVGGGTLGITFDTLVHRVPIDLRVYSDPRKGIITEAAVSRFQLSGRTLHVVAVANEDGTKTFKMVFDPLSES